MNRLLQIDKLAAIVLMLSFFLPMQAQAVAVMASSLYLAGRTFFSKERVLVGNYRWAIILGSLYLLYLVAIPLSGPAYRDKVWELCGNHISYLLFPLIFAIITADRRRLILDHLPFFVYGSFATAVIGNILFLYKYSLLPTHFQVVNHVTYRIFFETLTGLHPTYLSLYFAFSLCILVQQGSKMNRAVKYILFYSLFVFLISLLAKSPLIAMVVIFAHIAWVRRHSLTRYKWFFTGAVALLVITYVFIPFIGQRINEMTGLRQSAVTRVSDNSINVRKMIWSVDNDMLHHYWLTGAGPSHMRHVLYVQYLFRSVAAGYNTDSFDPHSEYFYDWLTFGILGIALLVIALTIHFATAFRRSNYLYLYLMLLLFITFFTESILARQQGIIFYSVFTSLFFFSSRVGKDEFSLR